MRVVACLAVVVSAGFVAGTATVGALAAPAPDDATGATTTVPPGTAATLGACMDAGEVWLYIRTDDGDVLRSECVGRPATGRDALAAADVATSTTKGGYYCMLAGYPKKCPSKFDGRYWQYYHAGSPDGPWRYPELGAPSYEPAGGTIEGWCYNAEGEKRCTLPTLSAATTPSPRVDVPADASDRNLWLLGVIVVGFGAAGLWEWSRRRHPT